MATESSWPVDDIFLTAAVGAVLIVDDLSTTTATTRIIRNNYEK